MVSKSELKRKSEILVIKKMIENGWRLSEDKLDENDLAFEKMGRVIRVRVSYSKSKFPIIKYPHPIPFDYLIYTNLQDFYILPFEILPKEKVRFAETFKRLANKFDFLDIRGKILLISLIDEKIPPSMWYNTGKIFFPQQNSIMEGVEDKRLKVPAKYPIPYG